LEEFKDPRAVEPLVAALKDPYRKVRERASRALGKIGVPAVLPLFDALKDTEPDVRERAAETLGEIRDPRAVAPLIHALKDESSSVRWVVAKSLGKIKDVRAVGPLIAALEDNGWSVQESITEALMKFDSLALEPLTSALRNKDLVFIARTYAYFIFRGVPDSEPVLIDALNEHGDKTMAQDFLNCGNQKLKEAADAWATRHGYEVWSLGGGGSPKWRSKQ